MCMGCIVSTTAFPSNLLQKNSSKLQTYKQTDRLTLKLLFVKFSRFVVRTATIRFAITNAASKITKRKNITAVM